jgi:hypothetical protein
MLRELSTLLLDLQESISSMAIPSMANMDMRVNGLSIDVPIDVQLMFQSGGVVMLADVARSRYSSSLVAQKSRLTANFEVLPYHNDSAEEAVL